MPCPFSWRKIFCASPNFLCQTKNLFIHILWQSQTFCARQNDELNSVNLVLKWLYMQSNFWAGSKNLDRHKTFWDL